MRTRTPLLILAAALSLTTVACLDANRAVPEPGETNTTTTSTNTNTSTSTGPEAFALTYASGHLGSYWDCPGDALQLPSTAPAAAEAPSSAGAARRDCADSDCGGPMNCEHAELIIRLVNTGEAVIQGLSVTDIELLVPNAESPIPTELIEAVRDDGQPLGAAIDRGASLDIIVRFKGLAAENLHTFADSDGIGSLLKVHMIFATPKSSGEVTTPELQALPMVAT